MKLKVVPGLVSAALLLSMAGCGGGGGSSTTPPVTPATIGGSVTGLAAGQSVTLNNNGGDALVVNASGAFTFASPVTSGGAYAVTVGTQPTAQGCRVFAAAGAGVTSNVTSVDVRCRAEIAYVANMDSASISQFTINDDGSLRALPVPQVSTGTTPKGIAVDPLGQYAYVANRDSGTVSQYSIGADGSLSPMTPPTVTIGSGAGSAPNSIVVDPTGRYLYVSAAADSTIAQFRIGATGALTPMATPSVATGSGPLVMTLDPTGRFAYAANFYESAATVSQYSVGADGSLSPLTAPTISIGAGRQPFSITIDPAGRYAYVEDYGLEVAGSTAPAARGAILQYLIGTDGSLTATGAPVATGFGPWPLVISAAHQAAFFSNNVDDSLSQCSIGSGGALTCAVTSANVGSLPRSASIDPSGRYLYVASQGSSAVYQFSLGAGATPVLAAIGVGYASVQTSPTFVTTLR